ncbi:hypothetical protein Lser_V15G32769 [Lactuca serriola]
MAASSGVLYVPSHNLPPFLSGFRISAVYFPHRRLLTPLYLLPVGSVCVSSHKYSVPQGGASMSFPLTTNSTISPLEKSQFIGIFIPPSAVNEIVPEMHDELSCKSPVSGDNKFANSTLLTGRMSSSLPISSTVPNCSIHSSIKNESIELKLGLWWYISPEFDELQASLSTPWFSRNEKSSLSNLQQTSSGI